MKIIVSTPTWVVSGVNSFNLNLLRGLQALGHSVELVILHQDDPHAGTLPIPTDIPVRQFTFDRRKAWWKTRWETLERHLVGSRPCVYLPGYDFQNASIVSALPNDIVVIGVVHSDDPVHYEHLVRMGRYWNAVVAVSSFSASVRSRSSRPSPTAVSRSATGVRHLPALPVARPDGPLRIIYCGRLVERQKQVSDLPKVAAALTDRGIEGALAVDWRRA